MLVLILKTASQFFGALRLPTVALTSSSELPVATPTALSAFFFTEIRFLLIV